MTSSSFVGMTKTFLELCWLLIINSFFSFLSWSKLNPKDFKAFVTSFLFNGDLSPIPAVNTIASGIPNNMAIPVVEFSSEGYTIRKVFD